MLAKLEFFYFSLSHSDVTVLMFWLDKPQKTFGNGCENVMLWLKIPVLITANTAGDVLRLKNVSKYPAINMSSS